DNGRGPRVLVSGEPAKIDYIVRLAEATAWVRDLVNTSAADLRPAELERAATDLAKLSASELTVTIRADLSEGQPRSAAVGGGGTPERMPRLIELEWGKPDDARVAIVGKGVCFDSGGLDLKTASGMRIMKKDMGGAAHALALAQLIIESRLPI